MANRHKAQSKGAAQKAEVICGNKEVISAARKKGGGFADGGAVPGKKFGGRLDKRARGGRIGYKSPFSSARTSEKGNLT